MPEEPDYRVVFVTAPDAETARAIVRPCLDARLAACANILSGVESHYWWKGCLEMTQEVMIVFKTRASLIPELEAKVLLNHPYETPEFIALSVTEASAAYLQWMQNSVRP